MTIEAIELEYHLSAKDKLRAQDSLSDLYRKGQDATLYFMTHPYLMPIVYVFLSFMCIDWLARIVPVILAGNFAEILQTSAILSHLFGVAITWYLVDNAWQFAARHWGQQEAGREGVNWGTHQLSATPDALTVCLAARRTVYSWAAFTGLEKTKNLLLLILTPGSAVAVPRSAFKSGVDERNFCNFVQSQITGA